MNGPTNDLTKLRNQVKRLETALEKKAKLEQEHQKTLLKLQRYQEKLRSQNDSLLSAQKEIEHSHKKYRDLFDFAPIGYFLIDKDSVIKEVNLTGAKLLNQKRDKLLNKPLFTFVEVNSRDNFLNHIQNIWADNHQSSTRVIFTKKRGKKFHAVVECIPITNQNGKIDHYRLAVMDISEQRELETRLLQSQKMKAIGTLAGGIAHDFNNILQGIMSAAEMTIKDLPEGSKVEVHLERIYKSTQRAKDMVKQILDFSSQDENEKVLVQPSELITETLKLLRSTFPAKINIVHQIESKSDTLFADPAKLYQVVMNLSTNALHAMEKKKRGGTLTVKLENVVISAKDTLYLQELTPGKYFKLTVSDNGKGMDNDTLKRIYEPYFTTKDHGKGSGMGMAVVHGIVKNHSGTIMAKSKPGKGTTIEALFPRNNNILKYSRIRQDRISERHESLR